VPGSGRSLDPRPRATPASPQRPAHGGPLTPAADTVHRLAHQRTGKALSFTLEALLDGRGAVKAHEDARSHMTAWRKGVAAAASIHNAILAP